MDDRRSCGARPNACFVLGFFRFNRQTGRFPCRHGLPKKMAVFDALVEPYASAAATQLIRVNASP
ncbi:MAG: hypothetical protein K2Q28_14280, partial [Hyphomicrobium sp.]|nr:hypothetical protein [Hyphomicrobium sp.]